jgi:hypothetical protein
MKGLTITVNPFGHAPQNWGGQALVISTASLWPSMTHTAPVAQINENMVSSCSKVFHLSDDLRFDCLDCNRHSKASSFLMLH